MKWVSLPFLGGRDRGRQDRQRQNGGGRRFEGDQGVLSKHEAAADFADKGEEDIVQDYNAPIRWWVVSTL